jgi:hypothetical protein
MFYCPLATISDRIAQPYIHENAEAVLIEVVSQRGRPDSM